VESVGAKLDAGADLAELGSALEHNALHTHLGEAECSGEAANAAAGNDDGQLVRRDGAALSLGVRLARRVSLGECWMPITGCRDAP
jgi:hypothetical protein